MNASPTKASEVLRDAVARLKASTAIDHWQRDREEIEADELLSYALGAVGRTDRTPGDDGIAEELAWQLDWLGFCAGADPRAAHEERKVAGGDRIEILEAVGGG